MNTDVFENPDTTQLLILIILGNDSFEALAEKTKKSERTLYNNLQLLEDQKLIRRASLPAIEDLRKKKYVITDPNGGPNKNLFQYFVDAQSAFQLHMLYFAEDFKQSNKFSKLLKTNSPRARIQYQQALLQELHAFKKNYPEEALDMLMLEKTPFAIKALIDNFLLNCKNSEAAKELEKIQWKRFRDFALCFYFALIHGRRTLGKLFEEKEGKKFNEIIDFLVQHNYDRSEALVAMLGFEMLTGVKQSELVKFNYDQHLKLLKKIESNLQRQFKKQGSLSTLDLSLKQQIELGQEAYETLFKGGESVKGKMINERTGLMECPQCGRQWLPQIKPDSGGKFYRGSQQCPFCK